MLTCKETSHLVSEALDRRLSLHERVGMRLHLWMCAHCRRFETQLQLLRRALREDTRERPEPELGYADLPPEARKRLLATIAARTQPPSDSG